MPRWTLALAIPTAILFADASGTWTLSSDLLPPDLTCEFVMKDGNLSGSCAAAKVRLPISDAKESGRTLRWTVHVPADTEISTAYIFSGELNEEGNAMAGSLILANGDIGIDKGTFTAKKR